MKMIYFALSLSLFATSAFAKNDGRYQLVKLNDYPHNTMMIDTHTGKIWKQTCYSEIKDNDCAVRAWSLMNVVGVNVTEKEMWKMSSDYEKQKAEGTLTHVSKSEAARLPASINSEKEEYQQVKGYIRSDGTYVAPYIRTSPNGTTYDNIRPKK
jgi:hypothetical protein